MTIHKNRVRRQRQFAYEVLENRALLAASCDLPLGDFDSSSSHNAADIDALSASVRSGDHNPEFDLDDNIVVDQQDRLFWIQTCANTSYGDANLDGVFDEYDFSDGVNSLVYDKPVLASWADGDFDGDSDFDRFDLVSALQRLTVPVPSDALLMPLQPDGSEDDGHVSIEYIRSTGETNLQLDGVRVSAISIETAAGHILDICPPNGFELHEPHTRFLINDGFEIEDTKFSMVAGLSESELLADLSVTGALVAGGELHDVDLIYRETPNIDLTHRNHYDGNLTATNTEDTFHWESSDRGRLSLGLFFDDAKGDAELELYRGGELLKWSATTQRAERIEWEVMPDEVYQIRVFTNPNANQQSYPYRLSLHVLEPSPRAYVLTLDHVLSFDTQTMEEQTDERITIDKSVLQYVNDVEIGPTGLLYVSLSAILFRGGVRAQSLLEYIPSQRDVDPVPIPLPDDASANAGFDVLEDGTFIIPAKPELRKILRFDRLGHVIAEYSTGNQVPYDVTVAKDGQIVWSVVPNGDGFESHLTPAFDGGTWRYVHTPLSCDGRFCVIEKSALRKLGSHNDRTIEFNIGNGVTRVLDVQETADGTVYYLSENGFRKRNDNGLIRIPISRPRAIAISHGEFNVRVPSELSLPHEFSRSPDRDGDGLLDEWEEQDGIDVDNDGTIDVPLPGADPDHKDLYVEIDSLVGREPALFDLCSAEDCNFTPTNTILDRVIKSFADVPAELVYNPDGEGGINLHLDIHSDQPVPYQITSEDDTQIDLTIIPDTASDAWRVFNEVKRQFAGTPAERASAKAREIFDAREKVYRYAILANQLGTRGLAGLADQPGRNFMVTLGNANTPGGTLDQQAVIFMHELGHTLGLGHGGDDDINFKPNYLSVMNYAHAHGSPLNGELLLDYSRYSSDFPGDPFGNQSLDELALNESLGLGFPDHVNFPFRLGPQSYLNVSGSEPIDWNGNGSHRNSGVPRDLNQDRDGEFLKSYSDWGNLKLRIATVHDASTGGPEGDNPNDLPYCSGYYGGSTSDLLECNDAIISATPILDEFEEDLTIDFDETIKDGIDVDWFELFFDLDGLVEVLIDTANELTVSFFDDNENPIEAASKAGVSASQTRFLFDYQADEAASKIRYLRISSNKPQDEFVEANYNLQILPPKPYDTFEWTGADCLDLPDCKWHFPGNWIHNGAPAKTSPTDGSNVVFPNLGRSFNIDLNTSSVIVGNLTLDNNYQFHDGSMELLDRQIHVHQNQVVTLEVDILNTEPIRQTGGGTVTMNAKAGPWWVTESGVLAGVGMFTDIKIGSDATLAPGDPVNGSSARSLGRMVINGILDVQGSLHLDLDLSDIAPKIDEFRVGGDVQIQNSQVVVHVSRPDALRGQMGSQSISLLTYSPDSEFNDVPDVQEAHVGRGVVLQQLVIDARANSVQLNFYKAVPGDSTLDRQFDTGDLIQIFQRGQYEDSIAGNSFWEDGDWNGDGDFGTADLITSFQGGFYTAGVVPAIPVWIADEEQNDDRKKRPSQLQFVTETQTPPKRLRHIESYPIVDLLFKSI